MISGMPGTPYADLVPGRTDPGSSAKQNAVRGGNDSNGAAMASHCRHCRHRKLGAGPYRDENALLCLQQLACSPASASIRTAGRRSESLASFSIPRPHSSPNAAPRLRLQCRLGHPAAQPSSLACPAPSRVSDAASPSPSRVSTPRPVMGRRRRNEPHVRARTFA